MANQVPANQQGELQGALTSLISLTSIIGPVLMTSIFYFFARKDAPIYFPGAVMMVGSFLTILSALAARISLKRNAGLMKVS